MRSRSEKSLHGIAAICSCWRKSAVPLSSTVDVLRSGTQTVLAIGFGPTASDDMPKRSPNSTPNNPTGGAASMINSRAANGETAAFGEEFAEPFLAHYDGVRGHPRAELCRNGIGSTALRGEVLCRNCNPAALLKTGTSSL
jgi:hypothetical protein